MTISRSEARELSSTGSRVGATVLGGQLIVEDGNFVINKTNVTELLEQLSNESIVLVIARVNPEKEDETKTCLTCGREYTASECPHCARVRSRLRG